MVAKIDRTGEEFINNQGCKGVIVEYKNWNEVYVAFKECKTSIKCTYQQVKMGKVENPYFPTVRGRGYLGQGKYKTKQDGKKTRIYETWVGLFKRCYSDKWLERQPTYLGCEVCEEWYNFQNFAKWYEDNYYEIEGESTQLDKDWLNKGNKVYSPQYCIFVPHRINELIIKRQNYRGELPIGVIQLDNGLFHAQCNAMDKKAHLGNYFTPVQAFEAYKKFKEQYIRQVAEEYKDKIPQKLYEAMYKWEVDIND